MRTPEDFKKGVSIIMVCLAVLTMCSYIRDCLNQPPLAIALALMSSLLLLVYGFHMIEHA